MRRATLSCLTSLLILLSCGAMPLWSQQAQASITGTVTDTSGATVPNATITAVEQNTKFSRSSVTSVDGSYTIPLLPPGTYKLTAEKPGFDKSVRGPVTLAVDQQAKINIEMKVGAQTTTISVESAAPLLETQNSSIGTTIEQTKVEQLPLNGRHFLQLTLFTPGVVPGSEGSELSDRGGSINVNGLRESMNTFLLDGMTNTSISIGTYSATPPVDSIQEFRMETGVYDARFGTNAGAQINMVTKSGTNRFHGSLYEYLRNNKLDARNHFEAFVPPFHRNQYGATLGGPLSLPGVYDGHDRTFFFLAFEGLRDHRSFFNFARVPTPPELNGNFLDLLAPDCSTKTVLLNPVALLTGDFAHITFPGNQLPFLDPVGKALAKLYPPPNQPASCGGSNFSAVVNRKLHINDYVGRFDHSWGGKNTLMYRYNLTTDSEFLPSGGVPGFGTFRRDWFDATGLDWTHTFTTNILNEAKIAYNRWQFGWNNEDQGRLVAKQLGINGVATAFRDTGVPNMHFSGYAGLGSGTSIPQAGAVNTFEYADTVTQVRGNHSLAYGTEIRSIKRGNFYEDINARSVFDFTGIVTGGAGMVSPAQLGLPPGFSLGNGLADALLGIPQDWQTASSAYISGTATEYDFFASDSWKVRRNLTLNLGMRYEYNSLVTDKADHFGGFDFNSGNILVAGRSQATLDKFVGTTNNAAGSPIGTFVPVGTLNLGSTSENRSLQHPDHDNYGPRIGFAWQPFGSANTVIRGGYGVYYDQMTGELYFQKSFNPPFFNVGVGDLVDEPQVLGGLVTGAIPLGTGALIQNALTTAVAPLFPVLNPVNIRVDDALIQQWSLNVQRELPASWLLDVGYVGTRGVHMPYMWDPNQAFADPLTGATTRPYSDFLNMSYTDPVSSSVYHSLQVKVERHFTRGLAVIAGYTFSRSLDIGSTSGTSGSRSSPNAPQNSRDLAAEKGLSDFDHRHRFSFAYVYDLPFGNTVWRSSNRALNYTIQGWQLSGIATLQSGAPFTPKYGGDVSCTTEGNDRPDLIGNPYPANQTVNQWVLASAFRDPRLRDPSTPTKCAFGNAGRDILIGPGVADWDFSVIRKFRLTESKTLEFRAEMFNIFNQANYITPESDASSASFGKIFNTVQPIAGLASGGPGDPRELQFALRFTF